MFIPNFKTQDVSGVTDSTNSPAQQLSNDATINPSTSDDSLIDNQNEKGDDDASIVPKSNTGDEEDSAGVSNIHFHLTVPRYYSPYEELPFLYFINSSITTTYIDQEKHYFNLHMGSSPFSPTYGLILSNLSSGSYTFHIGRAYNQTW